MNSLHTIDNKAWVGDGSNSSHDVSDDGQQHIITITATSEKRGTPYNVMLQKSSSSSSTSQSGGESKYFEMELTKLNGSLSVGFVQKDEFQAGWKTRGMFYNGNATNGSAALTVGFGVYPKEGDKVGVFLRTTSEETLVAFYVNGTCQGTAFRLKSTSSEYMPCLHVDGTVTVRYSAPDTVPSTMDKESPPQEGYEGDWKLVTASSGPELGSFPLPDDANVILKLEKQDESNYNLSVKVGNTMRTVVKLVGKLEAFDQIEVGHDIMSTMMMPPPHLVAVEDYVRKSLPILQKMIVSDGGSLIMTGPTAEFSCERYSKTFEPLDKY